MVLLSSKQLPSAYDLPDLQLFDVVSDKLYVAAGELLVIAVICNHCPYVLRIKACMQSVLNQAVQDGFEVVAISGSDVQQYPEDSPQKMKQFAASFDFPYLYDSEQLFLRALQAECTPEFYIFRDKKLFYHGRFDDSVVSKVVTGNELIAALLEVKQGVVPGVQHPSMGCSIKWYA